MDTSAVIGMLKSYEKVVASRKRAYERLKERRDPEELRRASRERNRRYRERINADPERREAHLARVREEARARRARTKARAG